MSQSTWRFQLVRCQFEYFEVFSHQVGGGCQSVAIQSPTLANLSNLRSAGFDACTLYSYAKDGMKPDQHEAPYDSPSSRRMSQLLWKVKEAGGLTPSNSGKIGLEINLIREEQTILKQTTPL
jgi:hypothetical protein